MLGGPSSSIAYLALNYSQNNFEIAVALARIASGKRVNGPGDDFAAYAKAATQSTYSTQYESFSRDLESAKAKTDYMVEVGNSVVEQLVDMRDLMTSYIAYDAAGDAANKAAVSVRYTAALGALNAMISNAKYDGAATVYKTTSVGSVTATIGSAAYNIDLVPGCVAVNANVNDITIKTTDNLDAEILNGQNYIGKVQVLGSQITSQLKLNTSIVSSFQASISALTDLDEAAEMMRVTTLQVRQQATIAMMAQANVIQGYAAKLYGSNT